MSPDLIKDEVDITQVLNVVGKEIQTTEITKPEEPTRTLPYNRLPLPRDIAHLANICAKDILACDLDQKRLRSTKLIRESVTGVNHSHPTNSSENATAKREKYCKEVAKTYLKTLPQECREFDAKRDNHLNYYSEDFPDYQPCYGLFEDILDLADKRINVKSPKNPTTQNLSEDGNVNINLLLPKSSGKYQIDATRDSSSKASDSDMEDKTSTKKILSKVHAGKGPEKDCSPKGSSKAKTADPDDVIEECFPKPARFKTDCYDVCSPKDGSPKRNSSDSNSASKNSSRERSPNVAHRDDPCADPASSGMVCGSQTGQSEEDCPKPDQPDSSLACKEEMNIMIVEAHNGTVETLKCAMEDFVGKIYQSTHDAVSRFASESSKRMAKFRGCDDSPPKAGEIVISDRSRVTIVIDADKKDSNISIDQNKESVLGKIMRKVESTASIVSEQVHNSETYKSYSTNYTNDSSKFDKPSTKRVSNEHIEETIAELGSSVENFIEKVKTKFYSILNKGSSTKKPCPSHDEDEKIMERIID